MTTIPHNSIIKANPKARRFILSFFIGTLIFGWLNILGGHFVHQSPHLSTSAIAALISHMLLLTAILMGLALAIFGVWIGQVGAQSLKQGCYPPANSMVMCNTELVFGWRATVKALTAIMLAMASGLGVLGISLEILGFLNL